MSVEPTVFIIDDDSHIRESLKALLDAVRLRAETFSTVEAFLCEFDPCAKGCVVVDIHMPGRGGLELQEELHRVHCSMPVIMMAGHADVPAIVRAMKHGAFDVLEKPFEGSAFLDCVRKATALNAQKGGTR